MIQHDPAEFRPIAPRAPATSKMPIVLLILVLLVAIAGWWVWQARVPGPTTPAAVAPPSPTAAPAPMAPVAPLEPLRAGPLNPVEPVATADPALPPLADADSMVTQALGNLLGSQALGTFLNVDGFVRRAVATVDNLDRAQAPPRVWPIQPTSQRFTVDSNGASQTVAADNHQRYNGFVTFVESIDSAQSAALYVRLYPLFQEAYEALGYPDKYFNDRLIGVIDHLLNAPEPEGPVVVKLTEVKGEMPLTRPWVRYEFAAPRFEALSSGQKIMVRIGLSNERRLKAKLRDFRARVAKVPAAAR